ncbi:MAG: hypothetical protein ACLTOM_00105 [Roseburia sp.]
MRDETRISFHRKDCLFSGDHCIESDVRQNRKLRKQEMKEAAQIAQATEFIECKAGTNMKADCAGRIECVRRPETETYPSPERSQRRSGSVYIFDDSFSALDYEDRRCYYGKHLSQKRTKESSVTDRGTANQYDFTCRTDSLYLMMERLSGIGTHEELLTKL